MAWPVDLFTQLQSQSQAVFDSLASLNEVFRNRLLPYRDLERRAGGSQTESRGRSSPALAALNYLTRPRLTFTPCLRRSGPGSGPPALTTADDDVLRTCASPMSLLGG